MWHTTTACSVSVLPLAPLNAIRARGWKQPFLTCDRAVTDEFVKIAGTDIHEITDLTVEALAHDLGQRHGSLPDTPRCGVDEDALAALDQVGGVGFAAGHDQLPACRRAIAGHHHDVAELLVRVLGLHDAI